MRASGGGGEMVGRLKEAAIGLKKATKKAIALGDTSRKETGRCNHQIDRAEIIEPGELLGMWMQTTAHGEAHKAEDMILMMNTL
ncbi:hypothetical protein NL676_005696 [Syzygium grande]|nr:hypothetical protein NL676_005696 [Syzygium grande]